MPHTRRSRLPFIVFLCVLCAAGAEAQSKAARKTLDEMISALGGQAFLKIRDVQSKGRYYSYYKGQLGNGDAFADYIRFPGAERTELGPQKYKSVTINVEGMGWMMEGLDVWEQTDEQVADFSASFATSYEYVTRFLLDDPDINFVVLDAETVNFRRADVVEFRDEGGNRIRYFVDRETRLPLKMQVRLAGDTLVREETYANWHKFGGVQTPLVIGRYRDGVKVMEILVDSVSYNAGLADSLFAP